MSRSIKFRVWSKRSKAFIKDEYLAIGLEGQLIWRRICYSDDPDDSWDDSWNEELDDDEYVIQQFTGLLDKNGREIYEGDILQYESHNPQFSKTIVRWTKEDEDNHPGFVVYGSYSQYGQPEIIGNIFENPELVE